MIAHLPSRALRSVGAVLVVIAAVITTGCQSDGGSAVTFTSTDWKTRKPTSLKDLRGSPVLMSSWATWCEPCKRELPELQKFYEQRHPDGLEIVAVNVNVSGPSESKIDPMIKKFDLGMRIWRDSDDTFTTTFDGLGVPMTVLIGADGTLKKKWQGEIDTSDREFLAAVNAAIREASQS
ncbi:MAG: TlpA disulfide reductase family protein [Acidimicrobiia bacterium]